MDWVEKEGKASIGEKAEILKMEIKRPASTVEEDPQEVFRRGAKKKYVKKGLMQATNINLIINVPYLTLLI
jgi:hypothetical protein